jgi:hypothetical protein
VADALAPWAAGKAGEPAVGDRRGRPHRRWLGGVAVAAALLVGALALGPNPWRHRQRGPEKYLISAPPTSDLVRPALEKPGPRPPEAGQPLVLKFDVTHFVRVDDSAAGRGLIARQVFSTRFDDLAQVSVELSRPAYGYLIAYATNGKAFLLDPPEPTNRPERTAKLRHSTNERLYYELNDGVGLHVFLAAVSSEPLPTFAEWQEKYGEAPWGKNADRRGPAHLVGQALAGQAHAPGAALGALTQQLAGLGAVEAGAFFPKGLSGLVWRQVGADLHLLSPSGVERARGRSEVNAGPVERLSRWWRQRPGVAEVGLTGFAVRWAE